MNISTVLVSDSRLTVMRYWRMYVIHLANLRISLIETKTESGEESKGDINISLTINIIHHVRMNHKKLNLCQVQ